MDNTDIIGFHLPTEPHGCFSNWYPAEFRLAGITYANSEQYMMRRKVLLAGRDDLAEKIMNTPDPAEAKKYAGREYFTDFAKIKPVWDKICRSVVKSGVKAKFAQNPAMLEELLSTGEAILAECAAADTIWGVGINLRDDSWRDMQNWTGRNYLGVILMELRGEFQNEIAMTGGVKFVCRMDAEPNEVWKMTAGQLRKLPQYSGAVNTYALAVPTDEMRGRFLNTLTLEEWENALRNGTADIPSAGFYEMKQDVYDIFSCEQFFAG